jgi:MYXO-CTERM domain-containing protein
VIDLLSSPMTLCLLGLLALAWALLRRRRRPHVAWIGTALLAMGLLAMTPAFANLLLRWLEAAGTDHADCSTPPAVGVVLAGGLDQRPRSEHDFGALSISSRRRVERAVEWQRQSPGRSLVFSGGAPGWDTRVAEARLMAAYAHRLGVSDTAIRSEEDSRNTWGNARNLARLQPPLPTRVTLVTSAMHVRRARYAMAQAGFATCTVVADSRVVPLRWPGALLPQSGATGKTEDAMHEVIGMLYYRWLAWRGQ